MDELKTEQAGPESAPAPEAVPAPTIEEPISATAALAGVFFSPAQTFPRIVKRPLWFSLVPILVVSVFSLVAGVLLFQRADMKELIREKITENPRASELSSDQIDQQAEISAKIAAAVTYASPVATALFVALLACIFWLVLLAFGESISFGGSFQATAWAFLPSVLGSLLFIVVLFVKNPSDLNLDNPIFTNPAAFFDKDAIAKPLYALLQGLDLFKAWIIALLSFALAAAAKTKASKTATAVVVLYAVWVLIKVGLAAIF